MLTKWQTRGQTRTKHKRKRTTTQNKKKEESRRLRRHSAIKQNMQPKNSRTNIQKGATNMQKQGTIEAATTQQKPWDPTGVGRFLFAKRRKGSCGNFFPSTRKVDNKSRNKHMQKIGNKHMQKVELEALRHSKWSDVVSRRTRTSKTNSSMRKKGTAVSVKRVRTKKVHSIWVEKWQEHDKWKSTVYESS